MDRSRENEYPRDVLSALSNLADGIPIWRESREDTCAPDDDFWRLGISAVNVDQVKTKED